MLGGPRTRSSFPPPSGSFTPPRCGLFLLRRSHPTLDETVAFVVKDHLRAQFTSFAAVAALDPPRLAIGPFPFLITMLQSRLPQIELTVITSPTEFFEESGEDLDGAVMTAERGSAWTLLYPQYSVVVPESEVWAVPLAYPIARRDQRMASFVNTWLDLKQRDGTTESLFDYWVLGKNAAPRTPRWSVIRNVLNWID